MPNVAPDIPPFNFSKHLPLLNHDGSLGFTVSAVADGKLALTLANGGAFPPDEDVDLDALTLRATTDQPIEFARGADTVSFSADASAFAGFGVYRTAASLLSKLGKGVDGFSLDPSRFGLADGRVFAVLRWGYSADARGRGAIALSPLVAPTVEVAGDGEGLFAVVRALDPRLPALDVIRRTGDSWLLPTQVTSIDQVDPGTWIIAEAAGELGLLLGAQVGYDFNWVREAKLGGLSGDIGLRLQMGINAAAKFSASGRCLVVVSRESAAKSLRLQLFRAHTSGLDLSFNAALGVEARDTVLPGQIDDFVAAVFDTHAQQILRDLRILEKWTRGESLSQLLSNAGMDGAENLIATLSGVMPAQLQQEFDAVQATAVSFVTAWHQLPHALASTVQKMVEEKVDLGQLRKVGGTLSAITSEDQFKQLLSTELQRIDFFHTPLGRILESLTERGVLSLVGEPGTVGAAGTALLGVLDGGAMEEVLTRFQGYLESKLSLQTALAAVTDTDVNALDGWLRRKLATFLGQDNLALKDIQTVRQTVGLLVSKRQEYYSKALDALHRQYNVALNGAYQSRTTGEALLDATFDFSLDPAAVSAFFQQAVRGRLDDLLTVQPAQVSLAAGTLTHAVSRQTHIDVSLPFFRADEDHLNVSAATFEVVPHEGGLLAKVNAADTVTSSNKRKAVLSLAMAFGASGGNALRVHQPSLELSYSELFAKQNMDVRDVRAQIGPAVATFLNGQVGGVDRFVRSLDGAVEAAIPNRPNLLGNGLVALDVSLVPAAAAAAGAAWFSLPADRTDRKYERMSIAIQVSLKRHLLRAVFDSPDKYKHLANAELVLAYCAMVPTAQDDNRWYWDWLSLDERRLVLGKHQTVAGLRQMLTAAQVLLVGDKSAADRFDPQKTEAMLQNLKVSSPILNSLLAAENEIVQDAIDAGVSIARSRNGKPSDAIKALSRFGSKLTEAFNADVTSLFGPGVRALGTRVFLDASRAVSDADPGHMAESAAMLSIEFLKPSAKFDAAALLNAGHIDADQLAVAMRVVA